MRYLIVFFVLATVSGCRTEPQPQPQPPRAPLEVVARYTDAELAAALTEIETVIMTHELAATARVDAAAQAVMICAKNADSLRAFIPSFDQRPIFRLQARGCPGGGSE
jgi:hypothetical protein